MLPNPYGPLRFPERLEDIVKRMRAVLDDENFYDVEWVHQEFTALSDALAAEVPIAEDYYWENYELQERLA